MSENEIYFPKMDSLLEENETLYHELRAYMAQVPDGPWHYIEGYDGTHSGKRYFFKFSRLYRPAQEIAVFAEKQGPHFSFSFKRIDVR